MNKRLGVVVVLCVALIAATIQLYGNEGIESILTKLDRSFREKKSFASVQELFMNENDYEIFYQARSNKRPDTKAMQKFNKISTINRNKWNNTIALLKKHGKELHWGKTTITIEPKGEAKTTLYTCGLFYMFKGNRAFNVILRFNAVLVNNNLKIGEIHDMESNF